MLEIAPLIYDLTVMLGVAAVVTIIFQRIRQPVVLGYLVAGIIIGPYTPPYGLLISQGEEIKTLSELGVIFLMFSLGLEFSFHKLTRVGFSASITGLFEVIFMLMFGYLTGLALGWSYYDSLFLGAALSISSTTIIIKAIDELKLKTKRFAELVFGVLIVEDLLAILLLVWLSTSVVTSNILSSDMLFAMFKLVVVVGSWFIVGYFLVPMVFRGIAKYVSQETLTIVSVALCLFLVTVAARFHYSTALGAFIMGSILAETALIHRIEILIRPIRDIFAAVFFISIGMLIDPKIMIEQWPIILLISAVTVAGKLFSTGLGSLLTGQSLNTSVRVGFSMAQVGEFSFIIVGLGAALGVIGDRLYPIIVAVSGITTFTTPYLIRFSGHISKKLEKDMPEKIRFFLTGYSAWVYKVLSNSEQQPWFRKVSIRLISNGIVVAIMFTVVHQLVYPYLLSTALIPERANLLCFALAIVLSSPFIWGMLFSFRVLAAPEFGKTVLNPVIFIVWLITLAEISFFSITYFQTWITIAVLLLILSVFFAFAFRHLEKSYHWFERQLITNISHQAEANKKYQELAPWDTHLVEVDVSSTSSFVGKTLGESQIRQLYGVNLVAIAHGSRVITLPRGTERIVAGDKLIVLGNDNQIDAFRGQIEITQDEPEETSFFDNFILKPILINGQHALAGKTIRDSHIRETVKGMVVGLERDNERILNPDPETVLQSGDLLLVVVEV